MKNFGQHRVKAFYKKIICHSTVLQSIYMNIMFHLVYTNFNDTIDTNWAEVNIISLVCLIRDWAMEFNTICQHFLQVT